MGKKSVMHMKVEEMTRRQKFSHTGLGKSIENDKVRQAREAKMAPPPRMTGVADSQNARSVLEQTSLDEFIQEAELGRATFDAVRGNHHQPVDCSAHLVSAGPSVLSMAQQEQLAAARRVQVPIPRRPPWHEGISPDELNGLEGEAFLKWRRGLAKIEEGDGLVMTPYEKNLDFWRQLWRCVERADLVVQILDARDPEFYRCHDLERYVGEHSSKKALLLVNKADFLPPELRRQWEAHFRAAGTDFVFFSALRELHKQQRLPVASPGTGDATESEAATASALPPHGPLVPDDDGEVLDCARLLEEIRARLPEVAEDSDDTGSREGVVGFVGYPNVGKSSVINALVGAKKVSVSRTPGKTKHLQTLEMPEFGITLCDCPGLVFPSVVATKAHLVINGTVPLTELRDALEPARLVVAKVGVGPLLEKYSVSAGALREAADRLGDENAVIDQPRALVAAMAMTRQHFLRLGVPDEGWGARKMLREYVTGEVLHCEPPAGFSPPPRGKVDGDSAAAAAVVQDSQSSTVEAAPATGASGAVQEASDSDFSDLEDFLNETRGGGDRGMTKRKVRQQNKRAQKGGATLAKAAPEQ